MLASADASSRALGSLFTLLGSKGYIPVFLNTEWMFSSLSAEWQPSVFIRSIYIYIYSLAYVLSFDFGDESITLETQLQNCFS